MERDEFVAAVRFSEQNPPDLAFLDNIIRDRSAPGELRDNLADAAIGPNALQLQRLVDDISAGEESGGQ